MKQTFFASFLSLVILAVGCSTSQESPHKSIPEVIVSIPTSVSEKTETIPQSSAPPSTNTPIPKHTPIPTVILPSPFATLTLGDESIDNIIVNTNDDSNDGSCNKTHCSLREAITLSENRPGPDLITFDQSVFPPTEIVVIELTDKLPTMYGGQLTIDATDTQVTIDGSTLFGESGVQIHGLDIQSSSNIIRGIWIQNMPGAAVSIYSQVDAGINAHYNLIDNVTAINNGWGIDRTGRVDSIMIQSDGLGAISNYNQIINCTVIDGADDGIELVGHRGGTVNYNRVIGNTVVNAAENGIELDSQATPGSTSFNVLAYNWIEGVNVEFNGGISLTAHDGGITDNNFIAYNQISNTVEWGIYLGAAHKGSSVSKNIVAGNSVKKSLDCGLEIQEANEGLATHNIVYLNSVFETDPCQGIDGGTDNRWDYFGIGNYWSNYSGQDNNHDGIGDTPYSLGSSVFDNHPLTDPP